MRMRIRQIVAAVGLGLFLFGGTPVTQAATGPEVFAETVNWDPNTGSAILTLVGRSLTRIRWFTLSDSFDQPIGTGSIAVVMHSRNLVVLRLPLLLGIGPWNVKLTVSGRAFPDQTRSVLIPDPIPGWSRSSAGLSTSGRVGVGTASPSAMLHVSGQSGVLFDAPQQWIGDIPTEGQGTRMMWYSGKAAFRAGYVIGTQWDDASVGDSSIAMGYNTIASGFSSCALGYETSASGNVSTAIGSGCTASGGGSTATGDSTTASGQFSIAMGTGSIASNYATFAAGESAQATGTNAIAMGRFATASFINSTAIGPGTHASGNSSTALGLNTTASGIVSTAMGSGTTASGSLSTAMGEFTTAQAYLSVVLGSYNVIAGTSDSVVATDPILVVGNGSGPGSRSNAFTLLRNGSLTISGTLTQNSDARLKKDLAPLTGVLRKIAGIRGVTYRMKDGTHGPIGPQIGLLAQEVRAVFPELVHEDTQGTLSVAYGNFSAVLLEAVKEQQAALDARDAELAALKKQLAEERVATEKRLSRLEAVLSGGPARTKDEWENWGCPQESK